MIVLTQPSAIRVVLFDAVGTVLRPLDAVPRTYLDVARSFGTRRTPEEVQRRYQVALRRYEPCGVQPTHQGQTEARLRFPVRTNQCRERQRWRRIVTFVFDDVPCDAAGPLFEALWQHFADGRNWVVYDDVAEVWQQLAERGLRLGLASNFDDRLPGLCERLPPLNRADYQFFSSRIGFPKPHPGYYREIQRRLGLPPSQLLMVGDDLLRDYEMPRSLGWNCVHLSRNGPAQPHSIDSLRSLKPDAWGLGPDAA
jgi:putative hydrolase of the HAD superfamily